jgi:hypothetical protein
MYIDKYIKILLVLVIVLIIYWCYQKYQKNIKQQTISKLSESIKNNITITIYNMNQFTNTSPDIKKILLNIAKTYNHNDIINILIKN